MADMKNVNENTIPEEEQKQNTTPDGNQVVTEKKHPVKDFFKKNAGKIKTGLTVAGAVGVGIALDKIGLPKFGKKKTGPEDVSDTTTE